MTSAQVRQSFLDFFKSKQHAIVPSSSLMPDSPNLLFTNAGMNQFVPIFLGQVKCPFVPGRAADTQKCIRAGGKHNDLEDVGLDTYHHTFFEMLGNWSFGDYFKKESLEWGWELLTKVWGFPANRLYATVYKPDPSKGDPASFDQEAYDIWTGIFTAAGLDPAVHIVYGNKKDNFWMMGDTGPCGPCSEIHVDLTPAGDTRGALVNKSSAECIEIWNHVFIQFNANADGSFVELPARHVDTGMGFERVAGIMQCTKNFTDFSRPVSNYESDVFRPLFEEIQRLSGKRYTSTLPVSGSTGSNEQEKIDVAFRVIADHIRTLSFAIADGIQPGNTDRNYVLRRILRRAVRYGRTLGFHQPFFYKLVDVLAAHFGDVFPEIRARKQQVQDTIRVEEEAFNKTLDRGIELFSDEVSRIFLASPARSAGAPGGTGYQPVAAGNLPAAPGAMYAKRNLPHFEKPWAIYVVDFRTFGDRKLSTIARDIAFDCILHWRELRYRLVATCVMPDHVHLIIQPGIKEEAQDGSHVFWPLSEILHSIKSFSANEINKAEKASGHVWQEERFDRYIRSDSDLTEKFHYVCRNPWDAGVAGPNDPWPWLWTQDIEAVKPYVQPDRLPYAKPAGLVARQDGLVARSTQSPAPQGGAARIAGEFAFKLYDTYGFPLDLTELMAREKGLTVDTPGFEVEMEKQRARARAAQKKTVIEVSQINADVPTKFIGYDQLAASAKVVDVVDVKGRTAVILDASTCYAEMGGQVGDTGEISASGNLWRVVDTQKVGNTWLHFIEGGEAPATGGEVQLSVDAARRNAIQRHHTVTHIMHWALHEVVSTDATQKGSFVGPDKLTFDFNSAALTSAQVSDIEKLVNERILENVGVSWMEVPYADVKGRKDVMQFFGDKYGDTVRVVQIGGGARTLNGYSMELCGGTHTRATGEIGAFRIVAESSVAAGVRRIEAVCGLPAYEQARREREILHSLSARLSVPAGEVSGRVDVLLEHVKKLEKELKARANAAAMGQMDSLLATAKDVNGKQLIAADVGELDTETLRNLTAALRTKFPTGLIVLAARAGDKVQFIANANDALVKSGVHCGKLIGAVAKIAGGGGGGKPNQAEAGGKDVSKIGEALAAVAGLLG